MDVMSYTLERIANQTASYNFTDGRMIATNPSSPPPPFQASAEDIRVNVLWFASLIISLITSSFGVLVKQWLDDSRAVEVLEPQARLRLRQHRAPQIEAWMVYEIVACLPLLLHLSLGLFFIGLCYFTAAIHASIGYTTLPLVIGWTFCLFFITTLPIFFPRCPYKISLFKPVIARLHRALSHLATRKRIPKSWWSYLSDPAQAVAHLVGVIGGHLGYQRREIRSSGSRAYLVKLCAAIMKSLRDIPDEGKVAKDSATDIKIFASIDAMRTNDEILRLIVTEELPRIRPSTNDAVSFAIEVLAHRVPTVTEAECLIPEWPFRDPFPLDLARAQVKESISNILRNYVVFSWPGVSYDGNAVPTPLRQEDTLTRKKQHMVLCTLTMLISDFSNFSGVELPSNAIRFLRYYLDSSDGPVVCRDILSLMVWHCADTKSCWDATARLITSLAKLTAPLDLEWEDGISCFKSIFCLKVTYLPNQINSHPHLTWDYPDDGVGAQKDWNIPDDAPDTLKTAALEYLFILLLAEFKRIENSKLEGSSLDQETREGLCYTLRHFMKHGAWYLTPSGIQAFTDLVSTTSEEHMDIMIESLVSTDLDHARSSAESGDLDLHWSGGVCHVIRQEFNIKPPSEHNAHLPNSD